jgi:hypothetical protein
LSTTTKGKPWWSALDKIHWTTCCTVPDADAHPTLGKPNTTQQQQATTQAFMAWAAVVQLRSCLGTRSKGKVRGTNTGRGLNRWGGGTGEAKGGTTGVGSGGNTGKLSGPCGVAAWGAMASDCGRASAARTSGTAGSVLFLAMAPRGKASDVR